MSDDRYRNQFAIRYDEIIPGRVLAVKPFLSDDRRFKIDVQAIDGRAAWKDVPVVLPEGVTRCFRKGQTVAVAFQYGSAKFPVAIGHFYNLDSGREYGDPMPAPLQNPDDQVYYHAETGAFIRFRSATSTATTWKDGDATEPVILEIVAPTPGGGNPHRVLITQQDGKQGISFTTAAGQVVSLDDVANAIALITSGDVGVGDTFANLGAGNAAITNDHVKTLGSSIDDDRLSDIKKLVAAMVTAGIPNSPALQTAVSAWTVQTIGATPIPDGSATVKIKE